MQYNCKAPSALRLAGILATASNGSTSVIPSTGVTDKPLKNEIVICPYMDQNEIIDAFAPLFFRFSGTGSGKAVDSLKECWAKEKKCKFPIIGSTPALNYSLEQLNNILQAKEGHVLIFGETGSGKELFAELLGELSAGSSAYSKVDCSIFSTEQLAWAELFGYEKGAFTGADDKGKDGVFGGNPKAVLLDEIQSMPKVALNMLMRFMETGKYRKLGGVERSARDTRIIAATNLHEFLNNNINIRSGLLSRFRHILIVPPLRYRSDDIPDIAAHFAGKVIDDMELSQYRNIIMSKLKEKASDWQQEYWINSNVRGLKNAVWHFILRFKNSGEIKQAAKSPRKKIYVSDGTLCDLLHNANSSQELKQKISDIIGYDKMKDRRGYLSKRGLTTRISRIKSSSIRKDCQNLLKKFTDYDSVKFK